MCRYSYIAFVGPVIYSDRLFRNISYLCVGQFMTKNIDIDIQKQILIYPDGRDPVPVARDTKMTGNVNKPCWKTMNIGIQGEKLIKGNILDYVVSNILEDDFAFKNR